MAHAGGAGGATTQVTTAKANLLGLFDYPDYAHHFWVN